MSALTQPISGTLAARWCCGRSGGSGGDDKLLVIYSSA